MSDSANNKTFKTVISPEPAYVYATELPAITKLHDKAANNFLLLQLLVGQKIIKKVATKFPEEPIEQEPVMENKTLLTVPRADEKMRKIYTEFLQKDAVEAGIIKEEKNAAIGKVLAALQNKSSISTLVTGLTTQNPDRDMPSLI